jgi:hypothetical protein
MLQKFETPQHKAQKRERFNAAQTKTEVSKGGTVCLLLRGSWQPNSKM